MKKLAFAAILSAISFAGFAQENSSKKLSFSAGLEAAMPIGDFADSHGFGIGASVQGAYSLNPKAAITLNAGYITYSGKTIEVAPIKTDFGSLNIIPVMAGLKYSLADKLYAHGQLGMSFWNMETTTTAPAPFGSITSKVNESDFTWSIGVGYNITSNIDVLLKFNSIGTEETPTNSVGLRLAYNF